MRTQDQLRCIAAVRLSRTSRTQPAGQFRDPTSPVGCSTSGSPSNRSQNCRPKLDVATLRSPPWPGHGYSTVSTTNAMRADAERCPSGYRTSTGTELDSLELPGFYCSRQSSNAMPMLNGRHVTTFVAADQAAGDACRASFGGDARVRSTAKKVIVGRCRVPECVRSGSGSGRPAPSPTPRSPSVARPGRRSMAAALATVR